MDRQAGAVCGPLDTALPSSVPSLARSVPRSHLSASSAFPRLPAGRRMPEAEPPSLGVGRPRAPTRDGRPDGQEKAGPGRPSGTVCASPGLPTPGVFSREENSRLAYLSRGSTSVSYAPPT